LLHGLRIKDGKATYVARFVKTSRLQQEEYYGAAKFIKASTFVLKIILLAKTNMPLSIEVIVIDL
jgi:carotenoid cleavage dioxygenase-like enzyme